MTGDRLVGMKTATAAKCLIDVVGAQGFEPWTRWLRVTGSGFSRPCRPVHAMWKFAWSGLHLQPSLG